MIKMGGSQHAFITVPLLRFSKGAWRGGADEASSTLSPRAWTRASKLGGIMLGSRAGCSFACKASTGPTDVSATQETHGKGS